MRISAYKLRLWRTSLSLEYVIVSCINISAYIFIRQLRFVAHDSLPFSIRYSIKALRSRAIDISYVVSYPPSILGNWRLWCVSVNVANSHHPPRFSRHLINWVERVHWSFALPLVRVNVLVVKLKVWPRPGDVLLQFIRLGTLDPLSCDVIGAALYVSQWTIEIRFDFRHITDIKFVMNKTFGFDYVCLRLQKLRKRVLTDETIFYVWPFV